MSRKEEISAEVAEVSTPLRRSSRINVNSPAPAALTTRRTSQSQPEAVENVKPIRTRRSSLSQDNTNKDEQTESKPAKGRKEPASKREGEQNAEPAKTRTRRVSVEPSENEIDGKKTLLARNHKSDELPGSDVTKPIKVRINPASTNKIIEEEFVRRSVRGRRTSTKEEEPKEELNRKATRTRRNSSADKSEEGEHIVTKENILIRSRKSSVDKQDETSHAEVKEKKLKGRRSSVDQMDEEPAKKNKLTPVKSKRQPSITDLSINLTSIEEQESTNEAHIDDSPPVLVLTPIKKRKNDPKPDLELSIINESSFAEDNKIENESKETPRKSSRLNKGIEKSATLETSKKINKEISGNKISVKPENCSDLEFKEENPKVDEHFFKNETNVDSEIKTGSDGSIQFHLNVSSSAVENISQDENNEEEADLNASKTSNNSNKVNLALNSSEVVVNRVSNVFRPKLIDFSFTEPMDIDLEKSVLDNAINKIDSVESNRENISSANSTPNIDLKMKKLFVKINDEENCSTIVKNPMQETNQELTEIINKGNTVEISEFTCNSKECKEEISQTDLDVKSTYLPSDKTASEIHEKLDLPKDVELNDSINDVSESTHNRNKNYNLELENDHSQTCEAEKQTVSLKSNDLLPKTLNPEHFAQNEFKVEEKHKLLREVEISESLSCNDETENQKQELIKTLVIKNVDQLEEEKTCDINKSVTPLSLLQSSYNENNLDLKQNIAKETKCLVTVSSEKLEEEASNLLSSGSPQLIEIKMDKFSSRNLKSPNSELQNANAEEHQSPTLEDNRHHKEIVQLTESPVCKTNIIDADTKMESNSMLESIPHKFDNEYNEVKSTEMEENTQQDLTSHLKKNIDKSGVELKSSVIKYFEKISDSKDIKSPLDNEHTKTEVYITEPNLEFTCPKTVPGISSGELNSSVNKPDEMSEGTKNKIPESVLVSEYTETEVYIREQNLQPPHLKKEINESALEIKSIFNKNDEISQSSKQLKSPKSLLINEHTEAEVEQNIQSSYLEESNKSALEVNNSISENDEISEFSKQSKSPKSILINEHTETEVYTMEQNVQYPHPKKNSDKPAIKINSDEISDSSKQFKNVKSSLLANRYSETEVNIEQNVHSPRLKKEVDESAIEINSSINKNDEISVYSTQSKSPLINEHIETEVYIVEQNLQSTYPKQDVDKCTTQVKSSVHKEISEGSKSPKSLANELTETETSTMQSVNNEACLKKPRESKEIELLQNSTESTNILREEKIEMLDTNSLQHREKLSRNDTHTFIDSTSEELMTLDKTDMSEDYDFDLPSEEEESLDKTNKIFDNDIQSNAKDFNLSLDREESFDETNIIQSDEKEFDSSNQEKSLKESNPELEASKSGLIEISIEVTNETSLKHLTTKPVNETLDMEIVESNKITLPTVVPGSSSEDFNENSLLKYKNTTKQEIVMVKNNSDTLSTLNSIDEQDDTGKLTSSTRSLLFKNEHNASSTNGDTEEIDDTGEIKSGASKNEIFSAKNRMQNIECKEDTPNVSNFVLENTPETTANEVKINCNDVDETCVDLTQNCTLEREDSPTDSISVTIEHGDTIIKQFGSNDILDTDLEIKVIESQEIKEKQIKRHRSEESNGNKNSSEKYGNTRNDNETFIEDNIHTKLNDYIVKKISEMGSADESSESSESDYEENSKENDFICDMAEEGEEDTPSEGSNDIVDEGESINSTESSIDTDDSYDMNDSFICDEEENELLSGKEYDLTYDKKEKNYEKPKKSRIIDLTECDQDIIKIEKKQKLVEKKKKSRIITMPTDSSSDEENENEEEILSSDTTGVVDSETIRNEDSDAGSIQVSNNQAESLVLQDEEVMVYPKRRKSSITIHENINVNDIKDTGLTDRIHRLVDSFCTSLKKGEISMNLSLEYANKENDGKTMPENENSELEKNQSIISLSDGRKDDSLQKLSTENDIDEDIDIDSEKQIQEISELPKKKLKKKKKKQRRKRLEKLCNIENLHDFKEKIDKKKKRRKESFKNLDGIAVEEKVDKKEKYGESSKKLDITIDNFEDLQTSKEKLGKKKKRRNSSLEKIKDTEDLNDSEEDINKKKKRRRISLEEIGYTADKIEEKVNKKKKRRSKSLETLDRQFNKSNKRKKEKKDGSNDLKKVRKNLVDVNLIKPKFTKLSTESKKMSVKDDLRIQTFSIMNQLITDIKNRPIRNIKPSTSKSEMNSSWTVEVANIKPSMTTVLEREINQFKAAKVHPKDFRNQMLYESSRIKRVDTKMLLKKRGAYF